jgi:hypothetical protein
MAGQIRLVPLRSKKINPTVRRYNCQRRNPRLPPNPLANQFLVADLGSAEAAQAAYREWFLKHFADADGLLEALDEMMHVVSEEGQDIELGCCGEGKHCHCEVIREHVRWALEEAA